MTDTTIRYGIRIPTISGGSALGALMRDGDGIYYRAGLGGSRHPTDQAWARETDDAEWDRYCVAHDMSARPYRERSKI